VAGAGASRSGLMRRWPSPSHGAGRGSVALPGGARRDAPARIGAGLARPALSRAARERLRRIGTAMSFWRRSARPGACSAAARGGSGLLIAAVPPFPFPTRRRSRGLIRPAPPLWGRRQTTQHNSDPHGPRDHTRMP